MTTPIINALDVAQQPPFVIGWQELDKFHKAITALYEQQTKSDREAMLLDDCLSLILRHRMATGIGIFERNEKIQGSIEEIARLLLSVADGLNTRLPETFIGQCRNSTEESASRFYKIIAEAYKTPTWKKPQENATSGTNGTGIDSNATTTPQTPPAGKETRQKRKSRTFEEFVKNQTEADTVISVIRELMAEATTPKEKAKIIVACTDTWINKPTAPSVKEEFGIKNSEFSTFKDCITFHYQPTNERAPKGFPFGNSELADIRTIIDDKIRQRKENNRLE